jgi:hypothetical protein
MTEPVSFNRMYKVQTHYLLVLLLFLPHADYD